MNSDPNNINPLAKKVDRILKFSLDQETLSALDNVSDLITDNNLNNRRNLRAHIEKQSLLVNEQFLGVFRDTYQNFQKLYDKVAFINDSCKKMMTSVNELRVQTSDFLKDTNDVNLELRKLQNNEKVLHKFFEEFQLEPNELALITSSGNQSSQAVNDNFFEVLKKIKAIHEKAKSLLVSNQYVTGFEIMELMSKYEEMANENLYRWTINVLRSINFEMIELQSNLLRSIAYLQSKEALFKHCLDEYTTVRRSAVSHSFIEALTRGRHSNNTSFPAMELYSQDILRYIRDMFSFLHQTVVFEKDMLNILLKQCNQEQLKSNQTVEKVLASITDTVSRPLKTRIENSLISNNKNLTTDQRQAEKTKNYFLVKNVINFYLQTFSQLVFPDSPLLYTIKESLILSDKVFYNSLNFYCSSNIQQKFDLSSSVQSTLSLKLTEHLNEFIHLIDELLQYIKSSPSLNESEHRLETQRILTAAYDPYMQYVIIYSSKLSSIEMTVFTFNCIDALGQAISKFKFTEEFVANLQKQIDENVEVLVNEQFQYLISSLSATSLFNAIQQKDNLSMSLSSLSGCDPISINNFLNFWDKFLTNRDEFKMPQLENLTSDQIRGKVWSESLRQMANSYRMVYEALLDPNNKYSDILNLIKHKPSDVADILNN